MQFTIVVGYDAADREDVGAASRALADELLERDGVDYAHVTDIQWAAATARRVEFVVDTGDHEVGKLRYPFTYSGKHDEPAEALEQAIRAWLAADDGTATGVVSLTEALDSIPAEFLAAVGLRRVEQADYDEVDLDDHRVDTGQRR